MVIAVSVVNSQQVQAGLIELPAALGADRTVDLQRFRTIVAVALCLAPHLFYQGSGSSGVGEGDGPGAS